jgi:nucleotide-binding universal stress UspA family protein
MISNVSGVRGTAGNDRVIVPAAVILDLMENELVDLLVIGSRGLGALSGLVMGSVSQKLVRLAPCPVLIVK